MIWSGLFIYWANDAYGISIFGFTLIRFFPEWFYNYFHIPQRLAEGMAFHFLFMWFFFLNGLLYISYTLFSGAWREPVPKRNSFKEAWQVLLHFKCVEGWDQIQHWAGVRLSNFLLHYKLDKLGEKNYMGLETPNNEYYVGLERDSVLHPQTILAYEMNGKPITSNHGAPLRLIIPVKYGIKNLKRIGLMSFSDQRPKDYWAEQGYDYYSGL